DEQEQLRVIGHTVKGQMNVAQTEEYIERLLQQRQTVPPKGRTTYIIKDVRLFLNSISRGLDMMRQAGVEADWGRKDTDEAILLTIRIPKKAEI
ncbi:MAG: nucleoid occlusion protein, partial [Oscillospiraceae bacterium]|nr:nucleoid occlusion protein [Oscillospiraceae bacterium]